MTPLSGCSDCTAVPGSSQEDFTFVSQYKKPILFGVRQLQKKQLPFVLQPMQNGTDTTPAIRLFHSASVVVVKKTIFRIGLSAILLITALLLPPTIYAQPRQVTSTPTAAEMPIIPEIDTAMKARLQEVLATGAAKGNRANVFIKVGDSITYSFEFLHGVGCGVQVLGEYSDLTATIDYFRSTSLPESYAVARQGDQEITHCAPTSNAFNRVSATSMVGWGAESALNPVDTTTHPECNDGEVALTCELRLLKPAIALIMFGTNHIGIGLDGEFQNKLTAVVDAVLAEGVIPVVSTIPPRLDQPNGAPLTEFVDEANRQIIAVTQDRQIPLWNYWLALQGPDVVNSGLKTDNVHPNTYLWDYNMAGSVNFTAEALNYGYNQRNLTALQVLATIKSVVIDDAPPPTPVIYLPIIHRS
jgi:hypothetical protein